MIARIARHIAMGLLAAIGMLVAPNPGGMVARALAQSVDTPVGQSPHERLLATFHNEELTNAAADSAIAAMIRLIVTGNPAIDALAEQDATLLTDLAANSRPFMLEWVRDSARLATPRQLVVLRNALNDEEAGRMADFYATDLARELTVATIRANDYAASANLGNLDEPIDAEDLSADLTRAATRAALAREYTPEEQAALAKLVTDPAFAKFQSVRSDLSAIAAKVENRAFSPEQEAQFTQIIAQTFAAHGLGNESE